jgi:hypothetical protein
LPKNDPLFEALVSLPPIAADAGWESRIRASCHSAIAKRTSWQLPMMRTLSKTALAAISGAAILCAYLAVMLAEVFRLAKHS